MSVRLRTDVRFAPVHVVVVEVVVVMLDGL